MTLKIELTSLKDIDNQTNMFFVEPRLPVPLPFLAVCLQYFDI